MKKILFTLMFAVLLNSSCFAEQIDSQTGQMLEADKLEDSLPENAKDISGELSSDGKFDLQAAISRLVKSFCDKVKKELSDGLRPILSLAAIAIICAAAAALCPDGRTPEYINVIGCCAAAAIAVGDMGSLFGETTACIASLSDYSKAAMPAIFSAAAASGAPVTAAARYAAVCLALDILISTANGLVLPLVYAFLATGICCCIYENPMLSYVRDFLKWSVMTVLTIVTLGFSAYITLSGVLTSSADAMAVKTAKTVIASALPVVGGIISDAAGVVLSAASAIKNASGAFSLIAVCALCAGPFAVLSVKFLLFKAGAALANTAPEVRMGKLLNEVATATGFLLALLGCSGILLFVSIMSGIKAVTVC